MFGIVNEYLSDHLHVVWRPSCKDGFDTTLLVLELKLQPDAFNSVVLRRVRSIEYHLDIVLGCKLLHLLAMVHATIIQEQRKA